MGSYLTFGQCGSGIDCQRRNAFRRHSSIHSGSCFFSEIARTTSSLRPGGNVSDSTSVTKPAAYSFVMSDSIEELIRAPGWRDRGQPWRPHSATNRSPAVTCVRPPNALGRNAATVNRPRRATTAMPDKISRVSVGGKAKPACHPEEAKRPKDLLSRFGACPLIEGAGSFAASLLRMTSHMRSLAAALLAIPVIVSAQDPAPAKIDAIFARFARQDSPGCILGVSRAGKVVYEKAYGMADLERDVPITPASIFHVASISKQFTAMSILLLEQQGKLSIDDEVRKYIPELPDYGKRITLRHLLQHTSGIRDQWTLLRIAGWRDDDLITEDDVMWAVTRQRALNFDPGAEYLYSNSGFTLLAVIVKRVSGHSLREFADDQIFKPLGMTHTHFHDDHTMVVPYRTSAYEPREAGGWSVSIPVFDTYGATSLFTTADDLLRWEQNFSAPVVGSPALLARMQQEGILNDGTRRVTR